jgi:hypothetical protein
VRNSRERVEEARVEDPDHGHCLVVAVALQVERGEAEARSEDDDPGQREEMRRELRAPAQTRCRGGYLVTPEEAGSRGGSKA